MKVLVLISIFVVAQAIKLPQNFKTCNRNSPDFKECLLEAANIGVKQLDRAYRQFKSPSLEPFFLAQVSTEMHSPISNITGNVNNCTFHGLTNAKFTKFDFDFERKTIYIEGFWPKITSECGYLIDGSIMWIPINSEGQGSMELSNFPWTFVLIYDEVKRKDKTYVKPIHANLEGKPEDLKMYLYNLFGEHKNLERRANQIINYNWSILYDVAKVYYLKGATNAMLSVMAGWFSRLSLEEAFDN